MFISASIYVLFSIMLGRSPIVAVPPNLQLPCRKNLQTTILADVGVDSISSASSHWSFPCGQRHSFQDKVVRFCVLGVRFEDEFCSCLRVALEERERPIKQRKARLDVSESVLERFAIVAEE